VCDQHNDGDDLKNASNDGGEIQGNCDYHEPNTCMLRHEIVTPNHYHPLKVKIEGTRSTLYHSIERNYHHQLTLL
jgi:hypothetical protein